MCACVRAGDFRVRHLIIRASGEEIDGEGESVLEHGRGDYR